MSDPARGAISGVGPPLPVELDVVVVPARGVARLGVVAPDRDEASALLQEGVQRARLRRQLDAVGRDQPSAGGIAGRIDVEPDVPAKDPSGGFSSPPDRSS